MNDGHIKKVNRQTDKGLSVGALLNKIFFTDFAKGFGLTFKYMVSKTVTLQYPDVEKWVPYERYRGRHTLNRDPQGRELCVACELCVKACPTSCITVVPEEDDSGRGITDRVAKVWRVDLVRCMYCGYCEDACPTTAVRLSREYETACLDYSCTKIERDQLLEPISVPASIKGGTVWKARYERGRGEGPTVKADFDKKRKHFW
jgi:NADH-quinone oxidoreductase subunit I